MIVVDGSEFFHELDNTETFLPALFLNNFLLIIKKGIRYQTPVDQCSLQGDLM